MKTIKNIALMSLAIFSFTSSAFATTTVSFYVKDTHGSMTAMANGSGDLTTATLNQYNDYGVNQSNNTPGQINISYDPYQYSGEYTDNESGLQPLGNGYRYYDPSLMRFISPDSYPLFNLYAYGSGNPIENVDPTGHLSLSAGNTAAGAANIMLTVGMVASLVFSGGLDIASLAASSLAIGGVLNSLNDLDTTTHLSTTTHNDLAITSSAFDIAANILDLGAGLAEFPVETMGDSVKKTSQLAMRAFTDINPTVNDILTLTNSSAKNNTVSKIKASLTIINQVMGLVGFISSTTDEMSTIQQESAATKESTTPHNQDNSSEDIKQRRQIQNDESRSGNHTDHIATMTATTSFFTENNKTIKDYATLAIKQIPQFGFKIASLISGAITLDTELKNQGQSSL